MVSTNYNYKQSHVLGSPPSNGISRLAWCPDPTKFLLSAASWDKTVRIWQIGNVVSGITSQPLVAFQQEAPVLDSCFNKDGHLLFAGGCENKAKVYDLKLGASQAGQVVAEHTKPINRLRWCEQLNLLATVSWDGHAKLWDGKNPNPVFDVTVGKICAMDLKFPWWTVVDVNSDVHVWNLQKISMQPTVTIKSNLKLQIRDVSIFADMQKPGIAVVEIAGRCGVLYFDRRPRTPKEDFTFRCHRIFERQNLDNIFAVNGVDVNLKHNTLATCGADGGIVCWDKDNQQKLKVFDTAPAAVSDARFHPGGNMIAYALSYDWHKGYDQNLLTQSPNKVFVHPMLDEDVRHRPGKR